MKKVQDIMDRDPVTVSPNTPVIEVARKMTEHQVEVIPVCENGKLKGVITERDIVSGIVASAQNPKRQEARSLMHNSLPKISPGSDTFSAAKIMASHKIYYLPVVQNGKFKGVLTLDHLVSESLAAASLVLDRSQGLPHAVPAGV